MIASLPMYDRAETAAANDRLWSGIRAHLGRGPAGLTRAADLWEHWQSPELLLSQTCGYPYRARLHGKVQLVGTPILDLDAPAGCYFSVLVRRPGTRALDMMAYNDALSQSGWAAPHAHGLRPAHLVCTGSHRASAQAVARGQADFAAIDALTWRMILAHDAFAGDLEVWDRTAPTPALPYITRAGEDAGALFAALEWALRRLSPRDRDQLGLCGITRLPPEDYLAQITPPDPWANA